MSSFLQRIPITKALSAISVDNTLGCAVYAWFLAITGRVALKGQSGWKSLSPCGRAQKWEQELPWAFSAT